VFSRAPPPCLPPRRPSRRRPPPTQRSRARRALRVLQAVAVHGERGAVRGGRAESHSSACRRKSLLSSPPRRSRGSTAWPPAAEALPEVARGAGRQQCVRQERYAGMAPAHDAACRVKEVKTGRHENCAAERCAGVGWLRERLFATEPFSSQRRRPRDARQKYAAKRAACAVAARVTSRRDAAREAGGRLVMPRLLRGGMSVVTESCFCPPLPGMLPARLPSRRARHGSRREERRFMVSASPCAPVLSHDICARACWHARSSRR